MQELQCRFGNAPLWIFVNSWVEFMCRMFMNVWCAGVVSANLSMLLQLRLALYLCDRFAAAEATTVRDFAKSMFLWLVEGAVIAGWRATLNRAFHFAWNYILLGIILILFGLIFGLWMFNYCVWFHQLQTQWDSMIPAFFWKCEEFSNQPWFWRCASLQCRLCFLSSGPLAGDGVATAQILLSETWITPPFRASTCSM